MKFLTFRNIFLIAALFTLACAGVFGQTLPVKGGAYIAADYGQWRVSISPGSPSGSGSQTYQLQTVGGVALPTGRSVQLFSVTSPIAIGTGANQETVTPTSVSGCLYVGQQLGSCSITVGTTNTHGPGDLIQSGSCGLGEAMADAQNNGGGIVVVDHLWDSGSIGAGGCSDSTIASAVPFSLVTIEDRRFGFNTWYPTQKVATVLAAPTTLTATTVGFGLNGANTTGGAYNGASTYHYCIAYVDIMGNEGPCSADFSAATAGTGTTNQIGFAAPAASTGAVGYTVYISLAGGTYNLTYQAPLTSSTCTLTKLETVTPACAVTNATYGQTGSNAIISALTVNTAPLHLLATTASTTAAYIGTPSGRTSYGYAPHSVPGPTGLTVAQQAFTISPAPATTVPTVIGTIPVPIGLMNFVGRQIRICGKATEAAAGSTATVQNFEFLWDAAGSNTTGAPVIVGQLQVTATLVTANADNWSFCWTGQTTVSGAGVTAGSIMPVAGQLCSSYGAGVLSNCGPDVIVSATGSLNLAGTGGNTQRIHIVWLHTTGTDANGITLQGATVEVL